MHRVQKLLSNYGYCSRRKAETLIEEGRVKVNGKIITLGDKATEKDKIEVDGKEVNKEKKVYLMFNKPVRCVTALHDKEHKTVMYYIKIPERVFPIGRLDYYTSGLLLLTNDGDFANKIMHPRYEKKKTYEVKLGDPINNEQISMIQKGLKLRDGKTAPAYVKKIKPNHLEITIHEGKNRIIRRMMDYLNLRIKTLKRIKIGNLSLGNLRPGRFKYLKKEDLKKLD